MPIGSAVRLAWVVIAVLGACPLSHADWPTFRHDAWRSGVTEEPFPEGLKEAWRRESAHPPRHAWPRNFRENAYSGAQIRTVLNFDHAYQPVAADGLVLWGTSSDHKVYCVDADSGETVWTWFAEGPIRFSPTIVEGRVFVGSDGGEVSCLELATGRLIWSVLAGPEDARIPGNEQIISRWPVRSGIAVADGVAHFAAGLFPHREGAYVIAVDAESGTVLHRKRAPQVTQGYAALSGDVLCVPSGKASPGIYDAGTGELRGQLSGQGVFVLINEGQVFAGGGQVVDSGVSAFAGQQPAERIASFAGDELLIKGDTVILRSGTAVVAKDRKPSEESDSPANWTRSLLSAESMIAVGDAVVVGGDGQVVALSLEDGQPIWRAPVEGRALALAFAGGKLLVGSHTGAVTCFATAAGAGSERGGSGSGGAASSDRTIPVPPRDAIRLAEALDGQLRHSKGCCLVLGDERGVYARAIAEHTKLTVTQPAGSAEAAEKLRRGFDRLGLYGPRVAVHALRAGRGLPYPDKLFNAVVIAGPTADAGLGIENAADFVCPLGVLASTRQADEHGYALVQELTTDRAEWRLCRRPGLTGAGDWTHQYGDPGNTSSSDDRVVGNKLRLQWFGRPGPYRMFDRHSYTASPVSANGRVFTLGEQILYGNDAYNGTLLWELELPDLATRVNLPRDCGFLAVAGDRVYVAVDGECLVVSGATGQIVERRGLPMRDGDLAGCWGYVALADGLLFGSGVRPGNFYDDGRGPWYDDSRLSQPEYSLKVLSDYLFAGPAESATPAWRYDGVVINSTITVGGGRVYFLENRRPDVVSNASRRLAGGEEWRDLYFVALDSKTGKRVWQQELSFESRTPVCYLSYKEETLILVRSPGQSTLAAYDAATGKPLWRQSHGWEQNHHGGHRRHPVLLQDVVYQQPHAYDLRTGEPRWSTSRYGGNCGTISASRNLMFSRLGNHPGLIEFGEETRVDNLVETTRPGCWINIIPTAGMVLVPEAGSGCSCEYPMHASMGFAPSGDSASTETR